jgi:hypothetical protein
MGALGHHLAWRLHRSQPPEEYNYFPNFYHRYVKCTLAKAPWMVHGIVYLSYACPTILLGRC